MEFQQAVLPKEFVGAKLAPDCDPGSDKLLGDSR